jgi:hypothetical protein
MAPGRLVSSPWPDRIEIFAVTRESEDSFIVHGQIVEITSAEMESGGAAATRPIALYIIHRDKGWLIDDITIGDYTKPPIGYQNDQYGFTFRLPESWQGYSVVETKWNGTAIGGSEAIESGPLLSIRHPGWTEEKPRQDIPVMVFTIEQWNALQKEEFAVSAAPIGPKKLGADARYVFALPPRYNFAFLPGYEEVEEILSANPLNPF